MATQESATCMPALVWGDVSGRPTFAAWLSEYEKIGNDYLESLKACGIDFASRGADAAERQAVRCRLAEKGASMRLGGASVSCGPLSSACMACAADAGSRTFFLSLACNRHCYFCFNRNQEDFEAHRHLKCDWRDELDEFLDGPVPATHIALTGGEPLLHADEAVAFIERAHRKAQNCHVRLYTDGDFLNEALLARLRDAGLTELRLSIKPDEPDAVAEACDRLALAKEFIPQVMVEMPVIPGTDEEMQQLLLKLDDLGIFGINLLEFGYPMGNWEPFAKRGFRIANPPFAIAYNYTYAGGLPVAGSELACLRLVEFALDRELKIGVHYCSLENKNRMQMHQQNSQARLDERLWEFDGEDFFWKTAKVFDGDIAQATRFLQTLGAPWAADEVEASIQFHPKYACALASQANAPVVAISYNALERSAEGLFVRELGLFPAR